MVRTPKRIIGTPFKSNRLVALRTNKKIRSLSASVKSNKQKIVMRDIKDRIKSKILPTPRTRGAIE